MTLVRSEVAFDVTPIVPSSGTEREVLLTATVVVDPASVPSAPYVVVAVPGGTYHRRYWDLDPPHRTGYSKAEYLAERGVVFVAVDYLGGGDSTRPIDGDFIGLEVQADAAHLSYLQTKAAVEAGTLVSGLPPTMGATFVGIGQSLGGFISIIQQAKYNDYAAVGIFGSPIFGSPLLITLTSGGREQPDWEAMSLAERREWVMAENARQSGRSELPMYYGPLRERRRGALHVRDAPDDLVTYDEEHCQTVIPRVAAADGTIPGFARPFADRITSPVFLAFGEFDYSADPRHEATGYQASLDVTTVIIPNMAHMHNFADTRMLLWERFLRWLPVAKL